MENKEIFELIDYFENSKLSELEIEEEGRKLRMKKGGAAETVIQYAGLPALSPAAAPSGISAATAASGPSAGLAGGQPAAGAERKEEEGVEYIRSPIVGVYYKGPSPDEPDFVSVGDRVSKGQTLCIIEAMKVMNELKSPCDGVIQAAYGINGELAEYDELLFEVKKC